MPPRSHLGGYFYRLYLHQRLKVRSLDQFPPAVNARLVGHEPAILHHFPDREVGDPKNLLGLTHRHKLFAVQFDTSLMNFPYVIIHEITP